MVKVKVMGREGGCSGGEDEGEVKVMCGESGGGEGDGDGWHQWWW